MMKQCEWDALTEAQRDTLTNNAFVLVEAAVAAIQVPAEEITDLTIRALADALHDAGVRSAGLSRLMDFLDGEESAF